MPSKLLGLAGVGLSALLTLAAGPAWAEKADHLMPLNIASEKGGSVDVANQRTEFLGDVVLSRGSLVLRAERIDLRETGDGYYQANASGKTGKQVSFRQARDVPGEAIEGFADALEYDTRSDSVRFLGNAVVRRTQGSKVADEVTGALIVYNNRSEVFTAEGGATSPHPSGRVRVVLMPRGAAAAEANAAPASAVPLQPSVTLPKRQP
ncbi:lipopolysaccharide transport periplasmic protein LptA [Roseateles albus]|uniref:Lipopolysaccharide export system protein LptA n=1 Tax=Roseateles albus TaxID=2987525 RepID=A0ABT5K8I9_9BURK|nr:lipopolysaccharide transport periplasmic protein LptA [Roseateles albus]MCV2360692.1 lipopolysaccharide transport periplasmic protein LptA [Paucibacter sp. TC2R-5]MDC8770259.1 lipopolysaccharide transport periplasmic protein LptA [Roseateles albus]